MIDNIDSSINCKSSKLAQESKIKEKANIIDKAMGVLINDGVYAYYLYCKDNEIEEELVLGIINEFKAYVNLSYHKEKFDLKEIPEYLSELSKNINALLFFKEIIEKILTYLRYYLKASGD